MLGAIDNASVPMLLTRLALGGTFLYLGAHKTGYPLDLVKVIDTYGMFPVDPPHMLNLVAVVMPWLEMVIGLGFLLGVLLRGSGLLSMGMLSVFTVAIFLRALNFEPYVEGLVTFTQIEFDCGCGAGVVNISEKLILNVFLIVLSVPVFVSRSRRFCVFGGRAA